MNNQLEEKRIFLRTYWEKSTKSELDALYIIKAAKQEPTITIESLLQQEKN